MSIIRVLVLTAGAILVAACSTAPQQQTPPPVAPPAAPAASPVAGIWVITVDSPVGTRDSDLIFQQDGQQLTGKVVSGRGEVPLTGTIEGDAIKFGINITIQGQELPIDYSGTVTGDTMGGTVQFGPLGDGTWKGKRKQAGGQTAE